jgi:hypothetical protein
MEQRRLDANRFERTTKHPEGTLSALRQPLFPLEPASPQGVRPIGSLTFGNLNEPMYMVMQNKGLIVFSVAPAFIGTSECC